MKVSSTAIGGFVVGAFIIVIGAAAFFSDGRLFSDRDRHVLFFDSAIQGLQVGAPVMLKGVAIGEVVSIKAYIEPTTLKITNAVYIDVDAQHLVGPDELDVTMGELIEVGMRAQLQTLSLLTGLLYIEVDFHPRSEIVFQGLDPRFEEIPTIPRPFDELAGSLEDIDIRAIGRDIRDIADALNRAVSDDEFQRLSRSVNDAAESITALAGAVETSVETLTPEGSQTLAEFRRLAHTLNAAVPDASADLKTAVAQIEGMVKNLDQAVQDISFALSDDSPLSYELTRAAQDARRAANAVESLARTLEQRPESILRGK